MKLYLVSRIDKVGYDQFFSYVVAAYNDKRALEFHPRGRSFEEDDYFEDGEVYEFTGKENLIIDCIGESYSTEEKVIIASFNAG